MKSKTFLHFITACLILFSVCAHASEQILPENVRLWADQKGNTLLEAFSEQDVARKHSMLDKMFEEYIDLEYISKFVMGKHWRSMTDEEKSIYQELFHRYALSTYKTFPLSFNGNISFKVGEVSINKDRATVDVHISITAPNSQGSGQNVTVVFMLKHNGDKGLQIIDLKLADASLILSYRSKFYEMMDNLDGQVEWFLEDLESMVEYNEKNAQMQLNYVESF